MASRRRSMALNPPQSLASSTKPPSRRASTATFVAPASSKVSKKAPSKPVRKSIGRKLHDEPTEVPKENSFVAGDLFDFNGQTMLTPAKSPKGPMTRARRSSMYVPPMKNGMVTSTARRSVTKKSKASNLDSVMETPTIEESVAEESYTGTEKKIEPIAIEESVAEESYTGMEKKIEPVVESPPGEVSFKAESMTPQMIEQQNRLLAKREGISPSRVVISPMKKVTKTEEKPTEHVEEKPIEVLEEKKEIVAEKVVTKVENLTPQMMEQQKSLLAKKEGKKMTKLQEKPAKSLSNLPLSPIKKVFKAQEKPVKTSKTKEIIAKSPKKKASTLPLPKLTIPKKIAKVQKENIPGTPQPTDPGNLLKKNLKRKVDVRMDKKLDEIPKNLSPYTLIVGETENGSPVENFVKTKPSKENITGTPAPVSKFRKDRVLQQLDLENIITNEDQPNSHSFRKSPRLLATPNKLNMSAAENTLENKDVQKRPKIAEDIKVQTSPKTPKLETKNLAVNKALAKQKSEIVSSRSCNSTTSNDGGQMITGDLASLCVIM